MERCRCVVRGSINIDDYFYVPAIVRPGETISSHDYKQRVGGKGANQAMAIAKAGGEVYFCGTIGHDGEWLRSEVKKLGMNVDGIIASNLPTGRALIQVADNGENSIVLFPGTNYSQLHEERTANENDYLDNATHVLLQNEIHFQSTLYALEHAGNAITIINPSPLPSPAQISSFPWHRVNWLVVNNGEAEGLYRAATNQEDRSWSTEDDLVKLLSASSLFNKTNIICTLGAKGVIAALQGSTSTSFIYVPAAQLRGEVRDTTGAGDCFTGYFVRELMKHGPGARVGKGLTEKDVENILKVAVQAAGISVERPGTIDSIPLAHEVEERLAPVARLSQ
ncbi:Ribokinase-like protein [Amanita muscaria]